MPIFAVRNKLPMNSILDRTCIVLLACNDFESTQLTIANLLLRTPKNVPIYFIPNSLDNTFDAQRVREIGHMYSKLYPRRFEVAHWVKPSFPYQAIGDLLYSKQLEHFDFVCKIDDDVFPITDNWLQELVRCFEKHDGNDLAYVTGLINNNPWGFAEIVEIMNLQEELQHILPDVTLAGKNIKGYMVEEEVVLPNIARGGFGTVWQFPHLARWIHEKTTYRPQDFIDATQGLGEKEVNNQLRYSIGCMFFRKEKWREVYNGSKTDEKMWHMYCQQNNMKIFSARNVPLVHLFFYNQRLFNRSILPTIYDVYEKFSGKQLDLFWNNSRDCKLNFMEDRIRELESRQKSSIINKVVLRKIQNMLRYRFFRKW